MFDILKTASLETLYMVFFSTVFALILGGPIAIVLYIVKPGGLKENKLVFRVLDFIINILRSIPFIIMMILVFPLSKLIVGKSIGSTASIVPLAIAAAPFVSRMFETSFNKVDRGIIEAAQSMGSSNKEIIFKVLLPEARANLINDITMTIINLIGYSAMAGSIGGGGLGDTAVRYGVNNYQFDVLIMAVIIIVLLVQLVQYIGTKLSRKANKL